MSIWVVYEGPTSSQKLHFLSVLYLPVELRRVKCGLLLF